MVNFKRNDKKDTARAKLRRKKELHKCIDTDIINASVKSNLKRGDKLE